MKGDRRQKMMVGQTVAGRKVNRVMRKKGRERGRRKC